MKSLDYILNGLRYKYLSFSEAISYLFYCIFCKFKITRYISLNLYKQTVCSVFKRRWLKKNVFDFNGAKFPNIIADKHNFWLLAHNIFEDTFLIPCFYNDNYDKAIVEVLDQYMNEGPYGYSNGSFDVTVKKNDVVIDAGAWFGDFSAYSSSKGAITYAFEPVKNNFYWLCKTVELNKNIYAIKKGLGKSESEMVIMISNKNSGSSSIVKKEIDDKKKKKISITTLDKFVEENNLERIDFIKADIEGSERDMLYGAIQVMKKFSPKLAICTYHLSDDPEILEKIILNANPNYKIIHLRHKLFACVVQHPRII
jgi:FkbM family methyltransferase